MTTAPRDDGSAGDDDPLPSLLARYRPAYPSGRFWVEQLAFAARSERRVADALAAVRARAGGGGPPCAADAELLASLARHRVRIDRGRCRALARLDGLSLAPTAEAARPPRPAATPRPAGGGARQRGRAAAVLPRLPARPVRARGRRRWP